MTQLQASQPAAEPSASDKDREARLRFISKASHDLRQPLAALKMLFYDEAHLADPARRKTILHAATASLSLMQDFVEQLIDYEKLRAGAFECRIGACPLAALLARARETHGPAAAEKGLDLRIVESRAAVLGDPELIEKVLDALVANAIAYSSSGQVLVGCRRRGENIVLQVWDSAGGVPTEIRDQIFEPYFQGGGLRRGAGSGLGLGLTIAQGLCGLMGSPLEFRSWPGHGSVFGFVLPLAQPVDHA